MSTNFWLPSDTTAAVSPTPSAVDWLHVNTVSRVLSRTRGTSALTNLTYTPDAGDDLVAGNSMVAQFVSEIFPPQTIVAQPINLQIQAFEAVATSNLFVVAKMYVVNAAGDTVLGTIFALTQWPSEVPITSATGRTLNITSTQVIAVENFRLVFEIGLGGTPAVAGGHNGTIRFGDDNTAASMIVFGNNATTVIPAVSFSQDLQKSALPVVGDVDNGVTYGTPGSELTGTLVVPITNDVRDGVDYGAGGVEFDGDLVLPVEDDVVEGVGYGADGTEFEGTFTGGGGTVVLIRR